MEIENYISEVTVDSNDYIDEDSIIKIIELQQRLGGIPKLERSFLSKRQQIIEAIRENVVLGPLNP